MPSDQGDLEDIPIEINEALVLHTLRIRGFVTPAGFIASIGDHPTHIVSALIAAGHVRHIEKRDMYGLLPPGKQRHEAMLDDYAGDHLRVGLAAPYQQFLELNDAFKQLCTDWQVRHGAPNDHTDPVYDQGCAARLIQLDTMCRPVIAAMAATLPRLARYIIRLARVAESVANGDTGKFTGVMCESYHDIWMELHEDLIVLQRVARAAEGSF